MSDSADGETTGRIDSGICTAPADSSAIEAVGTYESGESTVFYDTENPLAWVQSGETVTLEEMV
jgi:ribosomal protein S16